MADQIKVEVDCSYVGEFVDEMEAPASGTAPPSTGQAVPMTAVASYLDVWAPTDVSKEYTVLLRDSRVVTVRGQGLRYIQNLANPNGCGSYGVLAGSAGGEEIFAALFPASEVAGIFSGAFRHAGEGAPPA